MRYFLLVFSTVFLNGCMQTMRLANCIDSGIEKPAVKENGYYKIRLDYEKYPPIYAGVQCEKYYEAQCGDLSNHWSWRESGKDNKYQVSKLIVRDHDYGDVRFSVPRCVDLVREQGSETPKSVLKINGSNYFYLKSEGYKHTYRSSKNRYGRSSLVQLNYKISSSYIDMNPKNSVDK